MFKTAGSQVHLWTPGLPVIMCSVLKLHYPNSLLTLHKSGQSMCQPVTDCALLTEHGKIFTLLNFTSSFDVKQWSKSQQYLQTASLHLQKIVSHTD